MLPVIVLAGRPNVGKSTLFNRLTRSRSALVSDCPGMTRDRQYGEITFSAHRFVLVDTGGLTDGKDDLHALITKQAKQAIQEADLVIFVVSAQEGLTVSDQEIAHFLRKNGKTVLVAVNKAENRPATLAGVDFFSLALGPQVAISAAHGQGIQSLMEEACLLLAGGETEETPPPPVQDDIIRLALAGRPNVGKSTLANRLLGEERVIVSDLPGTTRDSIEIPLARDGQQYILIDTAGVRRKGRTGEVAEKFSVVKTLQAIEASQVTLLLMDAQEGITDQDLKLLGFILDCNRALVIAFNKWDGLPTDSRQRIRSELDRRLAFVSWARIHFISALHGTETGHLFDSVREAHAAAGKKMSTPLLNRLLQQAVIQHQPPLVHGRRIRLRHAHAGGNFPPCIVVHGNQVNSLPDSYRRYLANFFQEKLRLVGTPVKMEFRSGENPFAGKKNRLTPRQLQKKKRLMRHVKKK